jgi:S-DNA-T family DNA segregation ATPase FtsK/SpoIIIE
VAPVATTAGIAGDDPWGAAFDVIEGYAAEVGRQREHLSSIWRPHLQAVDAALSEYQKRLNELSKLDGINDNYQHNAQELRALGNPALFADRRRLENLSRQNPRLLPRPTVDTWLVLKPSGWAVTPTVQQAFRENEERIRFLCLKSVNAIFSPGPPLEAAKQGLFHYRQHVAWLRAFRKQLAEGRAEALGPVSSKAAAEARAGADAALSAARARAAEALASMPAPLQPWDSPAWAEWAAQPTDYTDCDVYAGTLTPLDDDTVPGNASFGSAERFPHHVSLWQNLKITHDAATRHQALSLARSLLLRELAAAEPGDLRFCFFDPVGLGQSASDFLGLADYDADLIGGKAWSSQADLAARLAELAAHIELVIQKYLRTTYETIDDFNAAAGEIAEPYRYLVLFDFPTGFTAETMERLRSIVQNGPRCGVRVLLLANEAVTPGYGVDPAGLGEIAGIVVGEDFDYEYDEGRTLRVRFAPEPRSAAMDAAAASIIEAVGRGVTARTEAAVSFEKAFALFAEVARRGLNDSLPAAAAADDEATWWHGDSTRGLFAPVGQKGARDAAVLGFDSRDQPGALLVGRPGSGKSTLLHTLIAGLTTLYSPRELELYLIDFKEGVEFKAYAEEGLPHARMVAIESDREFGLSVLQSLETELSRRGELLRATGGRHAGLQALREATGEPLPRVLLVFDEFQVLFARNDKLGIAAAGLLETIIRQGRGFGVHVLLGSQSLAGLDALGSHVPQLLPTRILLPATEADARRVLGDSNDAGRYLTVHGEGILNTAGGAVEANERFKGALLAEADRIGRLRRLRAKADGEGFSRRPTVFEGNASVPLHTIEPAAFRAELTRSGPAPVRLRAGVPMTLSGSAGIELRREAGSNVLAVVRDPDAADGRGGGPAYGLLTACVASAVLGPAQIDVIDFLPVDDGLDEVFEPLLDRRLCRLRRRRAFGPLIEELRKEVRSRIEDDDLRRPARMAFLFGIHRARELDAEMGSVDADPELAEALEEVMRDGPEAGVHVWIWSDSVSGASRRLSSRMMRECAWRVAGKMSPDDSLSLLGSERAADIRERQLLLANDDRGILSRVMSFGVPERNWLSRVLDGPGTAEKGSPHA